LKYPIAQKLIEPGGLTLMEQVAIIAGITRFARGCLVNLADYLHRMEPLCTSDICGSPHGSLTVLWLNLMLLAAMHLAMGLNSVDFRGFAHSLTLAAQEVLGEKVSFSFPTSAFDSNGANV
jgi:hypothetical protein